MKYLKLILICSLALLLQGNLKAQILKPTKLEQDFKNPPQTVKPSCFWFWLNNSIDKDGITRDLEEFKAKGMGGVILICGSNWSGGAPAYRGPDFLSPGWRELFKYSLKEASRLGMEVAMNFCASGWTMGGPWITPEMNGRWFVQSELSVSGPQKFKGQIPMPDPRGGYKPPYQLNVSASMNWPKDKMDYRDNSIVAFREVDKQANLLGEERLKLLDAKSNRKDGYCFLLPKEVMDPTITPWTSLPGDKAINPSDVIDLTCKVKPDGSLDWDVPDGNWTIIRTGHVATGAPLSCMLPEMTKGALAVDWLNANAVDTMYKYMGNTLLEDAGKYVGKTLKYFHTDSYEDGYPNWTDKILEQFKKYRGYDPTPYTPVFAGRIIGSAEISDRFLYDYRKTAADLFADGSLKRMAELAHQNGMLTENESAGPSWSGTVCIDALKNLGRSDNPMGEFWNEGTFVNKTYDQNYVCKQTATAAHIYGRKTASAESFTCSTQWMESPERLKPVVDRAFCEGINRIVFHTMTATRPSDGLPGYEYGAGTHFTPNVTWWKMGAGPWISYINRCSAMLQSGFYVADILFYNGDWAPNLVEAKHIDPSLGKGYDYDVCNAEVLLTRLSVKNGRIVLPDGMSYRILSLPDKDFMPVEVVHKIKELVEAGATVVGPKPNHDPGLRNYPQCDKEVKKTAAYLWGNIDGQTVKERRVGEGHVIWGKTLREILESNGISADFDYLESNDAVPYTNMTHEEINYWIYGAPIQQSNRFIDFIHRRTKEDDIYFLANRNARPDFLECKFRIQGMKPELWNPVDGTIRKLTDFREKDGQTIIPLKFEPSGSMFIVFREKSKKSEKNAQHAEPNFADYKTTQEITEPWTVQFDRDWFYPTDSLSGEKADGKVIFSKLEDWSKRPESAIKYFSGTATYRVLFNTNIQPGKKYYLDLGMAREIVSVSMNNKLLGTIWCQPWMIEVTDAIKDGKNSLEVQVVNTWVNRLIGDARLPAEKMKTVTNMRSHNGDSQLLPSGLLGPVKLKVMDKK